MGLQNATEELARLEAAFDSVKRQLFTRLHTLLRQQLLAPGGAQLPPVPNLPSTSPESLPSSQATNGLGQEAGPAASKSTPAVNGARTSKSVGGPEEHAHAEDLR